MSMVGEQQQQLEPFTEAETEHWLKQLRLLHRNSGHSSIQNMVRALQSRHADARLIELARTFRCSVCEENQRRVPHPRVSLEPIPPKWQVIQADVMEWLHQGTQKRYWIGVIVDEGCRFRVAKILGTGPRSGVSGEQLIGFFQEHWKPIFGKPDKLRVDPAGAWRSQRMSEYCDSQQIELDIIPAEAHWQISHVERTIGSLEHVMDRLVTEDAAIEPHEALSEAVRMGNEKELVRGYTPVQHAMGRSPDQSGRIHLSNLDEVPPILCERSDGEFHRNWERMKVAEQAFTDWTFQEVETCGEHSELQAPSFLPG